MPKKYSEDDLKHRKAHIHKIENPDNEPIGHYTGRCKECGSKDLWDDVAAYGCNACGAFWTF